MENPQAIAELRKAVKTLKTVWGYEVRRLDQIFTLRKAVLDSLSSRENKESIDEEALAFSYGNPSVEAIAIFLSEYAGIDFMDLWERNEETNKPMMPFLSPLVSVQDDPFTVSEEFKTYLRHAIERQYEP